MRVEAPERTCAECGDPIPHERRSALGPAKYCKDRCYRDAQNRREREKRLQETPEEREARLVRERRRERERTYGPEAIAKRRERCRAWAVEHRGCRLERPWLYGPPPAPAVLGYGTSTIYVLDQARKFTLRNVLSLHGALTGIMGGHAPQSETSAHGAPFAIQPGFGGCGWRVWWRTMEGARLAATDHPAALGKTWAVTLGMLRPAPSPTISRRGHLRYRIDAITPVIIAATGRRLIRLTPDAKSLRPALRRIADRLDLDVPVGNICAEVLSHEVSTEVLPAMGHMGTIKGWIGGVRVEVNAVGAWLLKAAETVGLGGRTAMGFGSIRVTEEP